MSPLMRERIGAVILLSSYDYSVVVVGFLMYYGRKYLRKSQTGLMT